MAGSEMYGTVVKCMGRWWRILGGSGRKWTVVDDSGR